MQVIKQVIVVSATILLSQILSNAQTWVLPSGTVTDTPPDSFIGIKDAGGKPLRISADNTSEIQFFTGTPTTQHLSIGLGGGSVAISTSTSTMEILGTPNGGSAILKLIGSPSQFGGVSNSSIEFSQGAIISQSTVPTYSSRALRITNDKNTGASIYLYGNEVDFGGLPGPNAIAGKYNFNDLVWAKSIFVSDYATSTSALKSIPKNNKFAVNGNSNFIGNVSIGAADTSSSSLLNIASIGGDQIIQFVRRPDGTSSGTFGKSGIILSDGAKISQNSFPAYGGGAFNIENGAAKISFYDGAVNFGGLIGAGNTAGKFNFNNLVWANSLVVSDFGTPAPGSFRLIPTGFKFAVNGKSNFLDNVVIGNTADFTKGFDKKGYKLLVSEGIMSEKFKCAIKTTDNWSDYVFASDYKLMSLDSVGNFIKANKHLPGVPSADEVVHNGLDLATMDATLLKKIEELTLYVLELKKENELMRKEFLKK